MRAATHDAGQPHQHDDPAFKFFDLVTRFEPEETAPPCAVPAEQGRCK